MSGSRFPKPPLLKRVELAALTADFRRQALENAGAPEDEVKAAYADSYKADEEMVDAWNICDTFDPSNPIEIRMRRTIANLRGPEWIKDAQEGLLKWAREMRPRWIESTRARLKREGDQKEALRQVVRAKLAHRKIATPKEDPTASPSINEG